ncbi:DUF5986 family protein [Streptococcus orisasini]|uniref:DUF5986 family protein n=1 Tax=Streptococcus orisasini TaxID=1080071 RepID=UPI00070CA607|nr:DUF5986 family protein [Streptococcus orisasini]
MTNSMSYNSNFIAKILVPMAFTKKDLEDDFRQAISKTSKNGLPQAVWARRSDMLSETFEKDDSFHVLGIQRGGLWQFDPVLEEETGILYLFFTKANFRNIQNKYFKEGQSTHYALSLLLKNENLLPQDDGIQLHLFGDDDYDELERKQRDMQKMLGRDADNVSKVRFVIVDYGFYGEAISAKLEEYTSQLLISATVDITHLLPMSAGLDVTETENVESVREQEPQLVTLKEQTKAKDE